MPNNNPTSWEGAEPRAWSLSQKIIAGMGAVILLMLCGIGTLVILGFNTQNTRITDVQGTLCTQIAELKHQHQEETKTANAILFRLVEDVAILKANQAQRLERERLQMHMEGDKRNGSSNGRVK